MANIILNQDLDMDVKAGLMAEDAMYEFDSGDENSLIAEIREGIKPKPAPPKVPKVFLSNNCIFNCAYCGCRCTHDKRQYLSTPRELAEFSVRQAITSGHGIFLSSAIYKNAAYTQELITETLKIIRTELGYAGYLHAKVMPGADPELILASGRYADRLSVNIEVARNEGYSMIAKNKNKSNILSPMGQISDMIKANRADKSRWKPKFASSQTTQLMAGSTGEDDFTILRLSDAMYKKYGLKRVYYTAFSYMHPAAGYEDLELVATPKWRVGRLYQADRLIKLYGFTASEIAPESERFLARDVDPKAAWALRNRELFPVEVNAADYETLIRVPGIGVTLAARIIEARRYTSITHDVLKKLGVSLKRCSAFVTCLGKYENTLLSLDSAALRTSLARVEQLSIEC